MKIAILGYPMFLCLPPNDFFSMGTYLQLKMPHAKHGAKHGFLLAWKGRGPMGLAI
jgi:hypothetical protein